jgi:hypothetical protein
VSLSLYVLCTVLVSVLCMVGSLSLLAVYSLIAIYGKALYALLMYSYNY